VGTIVPSDGPYTAPDGPRADSDDPEQYLLDQEFVGTGPYRVTDFRQNESVTLEAFEDYWGEAPANDRVLVRFFATSSQLKAALEAGEVDLAYRHLIPEQRQDLEGAEGITTVEGEGASIRYLVMNPNLEPVNDLQVRKAIAAAVDRQRIIDEVLAGGAVPLYSMIPTGFSAYRPAFEQAYADAEPAQFAPGTPVQLDLWYSTDHYGDTEPSIAQTLERTLEETGVFDVTLQSTEWAQFTEQAWPGESGRYPAYLLGWYPDYFDPDDYVEPFYSSDQSFVAVYSNPRMDQLIAAQQTADDPLSEQRMEIFAEIQQLAAADTPIVPLFEETPYAFARDTVAGVDTTMDAVQIFRYYVISKT
jgi:peptide/nickel transport system substrate-binding protein